MNEVTAQSVMRGVFSLKKDQDLIGAVRKPKKENVETIVKHDKIKTIVRDKITKGNLSEYTDSQKTMETTIDNVVKLLREGEKTEIKGGDLELTKQIYKEIKDQLHVKKGEIPEDQAKRLAKEMETYSNNLHEANTKRRAELKSDIGAWDQEVFTNLNLTNEKTNEKLQSIFTDPQLTHAKRVGADFERYAVENNKFTLRDAQGADITPHANNMYGFTTQLLENSMKSMGMTEGNEGALNAKGTELSDRFNAIITKHHPDKPVGELSGDDMCAPIHEFAKELKNSNDPQDRKLAFVLVSLSQNWVTNAGGDFGMIAREVYGKENFAGAQGAKAMNNLTHFDLKFEEDGSINLKTNGAYVSMDYETKGKEDFICLVETRVKLDKEGSNNLTVRTSFDIYSEARTKGNSELQMALKTQGYSPTYQLDERNTLPKRKALAANTVINAMREKNLGSEGIFRVPGGRKVVEKLSNNLIQQNNLWDPNKEIMDLETKRKLWDPQNTDLDDLASTLKHILREQGFDLIPQGKLSEAFPNGYEEFEVENPNYEPMRQFVAQLPIENQEVIFNLIQLCHEVAALSNVNAMTAENLGTAFGPSFAPNDDPTSAKRAFLILMEAFPPQ